MVELFLIYLMAFGLIAAIVAACVDVVISGIHASRELDRVAAEHAANVAAGRQTTFPVRLR